MTPKSSLDTAGALRYRSGIESADLHTNDAYDIYVVMPIAAGRRMRHRIDIRRRTAMEGRPVSPRKPIPDQAVLAAVNESLASTAPPPWREFHCTLVTPMYGGGVKAGEVDREMPIRATAIRGQLRFWWRLLNRKKFGDDHRRLFAAEREIWGGLGDEKTLAASNVFLRIAQPFVRADRVLPKDKSPLGRMIITDAGTTALWLATDKPFEFGLKLRTNVCEESVLQALRMWATFGGVGSRRRRGLGAVEVVDESGARILATKADLDSAQCKAYSMHGEGFSSYRKAVAAGVSKLIDFRQKPGLARGAGQGSTPGGSCWPEANAVRKLTGRARPKNIDALGNDTPLLFPRALLGLPIVFQFKLHESHGDPHSSSLEVANDGEVARDRFASPLILGALPEEQGSETKYRPTVLLLPSHNELRKQALKLKISETNVRTIAANSWWPSDIEVRKRGLPKDLHGSAGEKFDVLTAFINYFRKGEAT